MGRSDLGYCGFSASDSRFDERIKYLNVLSNDFALLQLKDIFEDYKMLENNETA